MTCISHIPTYTQGVIMNKRYLYTLILVALMALTTACQGDVSKEITPNTEPITAEDKSEASNSTVNEVLDEHYDAFVGDVYSYPKDYEGLKYRLRAYYRQVEHDGHFMNYLFKGTDERWMGFEIETALELPSPGSLILVVGTFKTKMDDGQLTPYLEVESLDVLKAK